MNRSYLTSTFVILTVTASMLLSCNTTSMTNDDHLSQIQQGDVSSSDIALIARRDDLNSTLHIAAVKGHTAAMRLLLDNGADVNTIDNGGSTALHYAALEGHVAAVRLY